MFGYIKPKHTELKVCEYELYKSVYCGLCHTMGKRICNAHRITLNYDIVLLALVRCALTNDDFTIEHKRCITHPVKKRNVARIPATLDYCADAAALLTLGKLKDDIADSKGLKRTSKKALLPFAKLFYKKAGNKELYYIVHQKLEALAKLESEGGTIDANADLFGELLAEIFKHGLTDTKAKRIAYEIGYHTGRFIYIIDACDDYEKDKNSGEYNPLSNYESLPREELMVACTMEQMAAKRAFDLIEYENIPVMNIINNILTLGMSEAVDKVFKEKKDERSL